MEEIIGSIPGLISNYDITYDSFITHERLIFVTIKRREYRPTAPSLSQILLGNELIGRQQELEKEISAGEHRASLKGMNADQLLNSGPNNFAIFVSEITNWEIKGKRLKITAQRPPNKEVTFNFHFAQKQETEAQKLFEKVLGSKKKSA
jgi:hypothetical protein